MLQSTTTFLLYILYIYNSGRSNRMIYLGGKLDLHFHDELKVFKKHTRNYFTIFNAFPSDPSPPERVGVGVSTLCIAFGIFFIVLVCVGIVIWKCFVSKINCLFIVKPYAEQLLTLLMFKKVSI